MDPEKPCRRDVGLGSITDKSRLNHGYTVTASSRGLRGRDSALDVPTTPPHRMYHRFDAP